MVQKPNSVNSVFDVIDDSKHTCPLITEVDLKVKQFSQNMKDKVKTVNNSGKLKDNFDQDFGKKYVLSFKIILIINFSLNNKKLAITTTQIVKIQPGLNESEIGKLAPDYYKIRSSYYKIMKKDRPTEPKTREQINFQGDYLLKLFQLT